MIGYFTIKIVSSILYPELKKIIPFLSNKIQIDGKSSAFDLNLEYRDVRQSIVEMAKEIEKIRAEKEKK